MPAEALRGEEPRNLASTLDPKRLSPLLWGRTLAKHARGGSALAQVSKARWCRPGPFVCWGLGGRAWPTSRQRAICRDAGRKSPTKVQDACQSLVPGLKAYFLENFRPEHQRSRVGLDLGKIEPHAFVRDGHVRRVIIVVMGSSFVNHVLMSIRQSR